MQVAVLQHVPFEGPALITPALAGAGADVRVVRLDLGDPVPDAAEVGALVVLGGPMGALDDHDHPHLARERALIADCVRRDRPVLGVCLGAQLLAAALGADVRRGPAAESGTGTVTLTPAGLDDPVLGPAGPRPPVVHWHRDTFGLPAGAVLLAGSDTYPHQAFRAGRSYGFQFHVEFDGDALDRAAPHLPAGTVIDPVAMRAVETAGAHILARWARTLPEGA
ncbi:type 1 glutamine amidotransferase [Catenuloplanes atrovinosus]|uniref:GMP synthase (Glutamine-hydrolyzing) n=1 Tax=Catenuloplanes atrovinosus TaxID=137266 RepID=A0AAE3YNQ8_9ACTN|nr:type 1 glutamine amidotransferase [Catenuloplanes atrovinosus]MDR7276905.1 GMP synthase (glutamine-hydrolyzing) [Catenuloplanes atrovinosus]